jgi:hypothetical protein
MSRMHGSTPDDAEANHFDAGKGFQLVRGIRSKAGLTRASTRVLGVAVSAGMERCRTPDGCGGFAASSRSMVWSWDMRGPPWAPRGSFRGKPACFRGSRRHSIHAGFRGIGARKACRALAAPEWKPLPGNANVHVKISGVWAHKAEVGLRGQSGASVRDTDRDLRDLVRSMIGIGCAWSVPDENRFRRRWSAP